MKILASVGLAFALATTACGPRQVEVTTGPQPASDVSLVFTNNLTQAVNLYVTSGGTDVFLKQVAASSAETIPVRGLAAGQTVTLKATTVNGTRTYTRPNIVLSPAYQWRVP